jgi:hypothetical protein
MAGARPAITPDQEPTCAGEPLVFPGLRGRAAGGHPRFLLPSPARGKTTQPLALLPYALKALFAADGDNKFPIQRMNHASARRVDALFACRSPVHKQKVGQRGLRGKGPIIRRNVVVGVQHCLVGSRQYGNRLFHFRRAKLKLTNFTLENLRIHRSVLSVNNVHFRDIFL